MLGLKHSLGYASTGAKGERERVEKIQIHLHNAALEAKTRFSELIFSFPSIQHIY